MAAKPKKRTAAKDRSSKPAAMDGDASWRPTSLDMGPERWIDVDGIRTRYFDQGAGERIVFIRTLISRDADGAKTGAGKAKAEGGRAIERVQTGQYL